MVNKSLKLLSELQYPSGLFAAAKSTKTGYDKAWIRDNIYATLGFEAGQKIDVVIKTLRALLDVLKKHEYKIDWMIKEPHPKHAYRYIHARYHHLSGDEIGEEWGNKQNDAIGALLFRVGDLHKKGVVVVRDETDVRILKKLVAYLAAIEYWHDADNGMWEEAEEVHASSIGACVAGLKAIKNVVKVPAELIKNGEIALNALLPCESESKYVDLALLSLIYPYNIVSEEQKKEILRRVEQLLVRNKGVIRYVGDKYYSCKLGEAEWTLGFPWLAIIHKQMKDLVRSEFYLEKAREVMKANGELPELYFGGTSVHNENTPLAWSQSLLAVAEA